MTDYSRIPVQNRPKLFVATYCIGEPPDVEGVLSTFWDGMSSIVSRDAQMPIWLLELDMRRHPHQRDGVYFMASYAYPVANVGGLVRCECLVFTTPWDNSGEYCYGAYPMHVNFAFSDNNLWQIPPAEYQVGYAMMTAERAFNITYGFPDEQRFYLMQGGWVHRQQYVGLRRQDIG